MTSRWGSLLEGRAPGTGKLAILALAGFVTLSACSSGPAPTPYPTPVPTPPAAAAKLTAQQYLAAWAAGNFEAMWDLLAPIDQARVGHARFVALHRQFATLVHETGLVATPGDPQPAALPPEARLPAPVARGSQQPGASGTPGLSGTPSASETPSAFATPGVSPSGSEVSVGGLAALRAMVKTLKDGNCVGITPDGPRGPAMQASPGIVAAARLAQVPIVPLAYATRRRRIMATWAR